MEEDRANVLEMLEAQMAVCRQIDLALEEDVLEGPRRTELLDIRASHMDAIGRLRSRLQEEGEVSQSQARSQQRSPSETPAYAAAPSAAPAVAATIDVETARQGQYARYESVFLEAAVVICCISLALHNYSGPRSLMAAVSFTVCLQQIYEARKFGGATAKSLRPRLALLYLVHWSLDAAHLWLFGTTDDALRIARAMTAGFWELALLFGMVTALVGACAGQHGRTAMGRVVAAQAVLGVRARITWSLSRSHLSGEEGLEYLRAAAGAQIVFPLLTAVLGHLYALARSHSANAR